MKRNLDRDFIAIAGAVASTTLLFAGGAEQSAGRIRVIMSADFPPIGVVKGGDAPNTMKSDPDDMQSMVRFLLYANEPEDPTQPGWGGQYRRKAGTNHYVDGPGGSSISRWRGDFQKELAERADWCVGQGTERSKKAIAPAKAAAAPATGTSESKAAPPATRSRTPATRRGPAAGGYKPRIINTTDLGADPDDEQSMVRQLVCANEFDIEGLIVATGCWKKSQSSTAMLDKLLDAYGKVVGNLSVHAEGFPSLEYLKSVSVMGQKGYGMGDVGTGKDSPGSELIIAAVDKDDPRPVWLTGWGGMNTIAQALWKVRETRSAEEFAKFRSKIRLFDILGQDDAGAWIAKNFPDILYIRATGVYGWQPPKNGSYQKNDIQSHGPLGAVYPDTKWATEGDTPAFMHVYPNGLNDPDQLDQGGWGGRFDLARKAGIRSMKAVDKKTEAGYDPYLMHGNTPEGAKAIKRWSKGYDNDFAARMDWSITGNYADANHHPVAVVNGDRSRKVLEVPASAGSGIVLAAEGSSDPDGDSLSYSWSFYKEPGSYDGSVMIDGNSSPAAKVAIPADAGGKTIHVILEIHDDGSPNLYAYRRVILNVK